MRSPRPDMCLRSFEEVTPDLLCRITDADECAMFFDLDGSVIGHHETRIPDRYLWTFERLGRDERINAMAAVSNAGEDRAERAHDIVLHQASEAAQKEIFCVTSHETGHAKPSPEIIREASALTGVPLERTCHVGDQWFKDVWAAKRAGCGGTILLPPYRTAGEHRLTHHVQRPLEAVARLALGLPCRTADFGLQETNGHYRAKLVSYGSAAVMAAGGATEIFGPGQIAAGLYTLFNSGLLAYTGMASGRRERQTRSIEQLDHLIKLHEISNNVAEKIA